MPSILPQLPGSRHAALATLSALFDQVFRKICGMLRLVRFLCEKLRRRVVCESRLWVGCAKGKSPQAASLGAYGIRDLRDCAPVNVQEVHWV
jgi:hypothetical protein